MSRVAAVFALYAMMVLLMHVIPIGGGLEQRYVFTIRLDHLLHATGFLPWCALAWFYVYRSSERRVVRALGWIGAGVLFAVACESVQSLIPHRTFNPVDLAANTAGVLIGVWVLLFDPYLLVARVRKALEST